MVEHLNDTLKHFTQEEARILLRMFYNGAYHLDEYHPTGAFYVWDYLLRNKIKFNRAIDIGCGPGNGVQISQARGDKMFGIDFAMPLIKVWNKKSISHVCACSDLLNMPFKDNTFDFVICNDVLEHIPEFDIDKSLQEIRRVGSDKFFLAISISEECYPVVGQIHAHITVKPKEGWKDKFKNNGYDIAAEVDSEGKNTNHIAVFLAKDKNQYIKEGKLFREWGNYD